MKWVEDDPDTVRHLCPHCGALIDQAQYLAIAAAAALTGIGLATGVFTPTAQAVPGQCTMTPWGGFCDNPPAGDGSFWHCEGALGFTNCYQACLGADGRPFPTDVDYTTPC